MHHPKSRAVLLFAVVIVPFILAACSRALSRDEAKRLIVADRAYPKAVPSQIEVPAGTVWTCRASDVSSLQAVKFAISEGLLVLRETGRRRQNNVCDSYYAAEIVLSLTPAGQRLVVKKIPASFVGQGDRVFFRACEVEFGEVTGVTMGEAKADAEVEFTERYVRPTKWVDGGGSCVDGQTATWNASFTKYDDGWRIASR